MNLYESIKNNSTKLTESVNGFIHIVWGPEASEDNLDDNERWELVGLVNAIEDAEDDYNNGNLDLESFINLIKEECKAHGLSEEETKTAAAFYEKSYKGEEQEDEESFIMHNENSDKDVRVWKQDGKWYDEEGNRYMGYLSKQDVKNYFKGNWHEVKESDDVFFGSKEFEDKYKDIIHYDHIDDFIDKYEDEIYEGLDSIYHGYLFPNDEVYLQDINEDYIYDYIGTHMKDKFNEFIKQQEKKESDDIEKNKELQSKAKALALDSEEDKTFVKKVKDNNGTFFDIFKTKEGKYVDANNRPLDDEDLKQFGLEESALTENVGDKNDYSDKIKALATKFCKQHYGRLSTYFKGIEIESKTTPTAIKYKLTLDVLTNLSRVYDDVQELADFISGHIPAVKFVKSDTYNITGSDLNEDLNLYFIQNTEFKDVGGDNVMEDSELKEFYDNPEPTDDTTSVEGTVTITYKFTRDIPKNWNYEQLFDDIKDNLSEYQDEVVDFEVDCSYEGPQDYEDRRADEHYDEERLNND